MKKAVHIVTLVIYPILMFLIEATSFGVLFWRGKGMEANEIGMCMLIIGMLAVHYFIFIITSDKSPDRFFMHLLGCTYLLGVDVLYVLFMSILCFSVPPVVIFQLIVVAVRCFYIAMQWRRYKRLQEVAS